MLSLLPLEKVPASSIAEAIRTPDFSAGLLKRISGCPDYVPSTMKFPSSLHIYVLAYITCYQLEPAQLCMGFSEWWLKIGSTSMRIIETRNKYGSLCFRFYRHNLSHCSPKSRENSKGELILILYRPLFNGQQVIAIDRFLLAIDS